MEVFTHTLAGALRRNDPKADLEPKELTEPGMMEIDRSDIGKDTPAKKKAKHQTLKQKFAAQWEKKPTFGIKSTEEVNANETKAKCCPPPQSGPQSAVRRTVDRLRSPLTPEAINNIAVPMFLFTTFSAVKIGLFDVMPLMYEGRPGMILAQQILVMTLFVQMMTNWLGIRYVDSSYARYIRRYGTPKFFGSSDNRQTSNEKATVSELTSDAAIANAEMERRKNQRNNIQDLIKPQTSSPKPQVPITGGTVTYPYWSWCPCFDCRKVRPPRCHHCPICKACILKRDHHCFFAGTCVGYRNYRFFVTFLVWACMGTLYATLNGVPYVYMFLWEDMSGFDVLFPVAIIRFIFGYISFQTALCVTTIWLLCYFDMLTLSFVHEHSHLIYSGLTSFEKKCIRKTTQILDTRTTSQKLRAVFGPNWLIGFVLPFVRFFSEPEEDPIEWPDVKVIKHAL